MVLICFCENTFIPTQVHKTTSSR